MIFEFAVPTTVIVNSVGSELASVIQHQLSHRAEPPIFIHQLIDYKLAVLSIDLGELLACAVARVRAREGPAIDDRSTICSYQSFVIGT